MKCQILFSGKKYKKNNVNLSSAELAHGVVKVNKHELEDSYKTEAPFFR